MSGSLPSWNRLLVGQPGGYKSSAHLNDGKEIGKDLSGGFYDAGGKFLSQSFCVKLHYYKGCTAGVVS